MTKSPAAPPIAASGASRFAGLDGLRAIAVVLVMVFHLSPGFVPGGYLGVDVFFVISGFLITALLLREKTKTGRIALANFWRRRARRLLPALGLLLLVCGSAAWAVGGDVLIGLGRQVLGAVSFSSNWLAIADGTSYFDETTPELFRNLWSLAVEEQFYLLWPLAVLALLLTNRHIRVAIVAACAIGSGLAMALVYLPGGDATRVYFGTDTHSFGLALGAVLAILHHDWSFALERLSARMRAALQVLGALSVGGLLVVAALMPDDSVLAYRGGLPLVAVLSALAIAGSVVPGSILGRALDVAPMRWIGERSYGLYLWHWPAYVLLAAALATWPRSGAPGWALGGIVLVLTVVAAALSYRYVEQPIRRGGFRRAVRSMAAGVRASRSKLAGAGAVALLVVGGGVSTGAAIAADPGVSQAQVTIEQGQAAITAPQPSPSPTQKAPVALPEGSRITAIGDSVMLASAPELQSAFPGIQIDAVVSRQLAEAPAVLTALRDQGLLRDTVLLGLGTNGPIDEAMLDRIRAIATPARHIVVVNVQAPRGWTAGVNEALTRFAQQYRDVELANWRDAIAGHLGLLARDQIHPGARGGLIYVAAVRDALQRLAELPPVLAPKEYGLAPAPV
ncbi:acyltransferase family protein [Parafrigoribacterium mesophilum]|uniref:acyltransferase family protein n=1 Tax=Parafrigoribacterium mesophilum TaxID=433646 RepID=UPI0031FDA5CB